MDNYETIAVVEVRYFVTALKVIDIMCKESNVELLNAEKYLGGRLVTVIVGGDISSVTQAIELVKMNFNNDTSVIKNVLVITRPHKEILKYIIKKKEEVKVAVTEELPMPIEEKIAIRKSRRNNNNTGRKQ